MASTSNAVLSTNAKGEKITVPTKVQRYYRGKAPRGVAQSESSSDEEEQINVKSGKIIKEIEIKLAKEDYIREPIVIQSEFHAMDLNRPAVKEAKQIRHDNEAGEIKGGRVDRRLQRIQATKVNRADNREERLAAERRFIREQAQIMRQQEEQYQPPEPEDEAEEETEYETDSSEEEVRLKPVFVPKDQRVTVTELKQREKKEEEAEIRRAEKRAERKQESRMLVQQVRQDTNEHESDVDTDGDEETEYAAWREREMQRIKRRQEERDQIEKEKQEKARREALTEEERQAEDEERVAKQREEEEERKATMEKPRFMQKYFHRGAFYIDESDDLLGRNFMAPTENEPVNRENLPTPMHVRDFGKSSQTKWTHLTAEDTSHKDAGWQQELGVARRANAGLHNETKRRKYN